MSIGHKDHSDHLPIDIIAAHHLRNTWEQSSTVFSFLHASRRAQVAAWLHQYKLQLQ